MALPKGVKSINLSIIFLKEDIFVVWLFTLCQCQINLVWHFTMEWLRLEPANWSIQSSAKGFEPTDTGVTPTFYLFHHSKLITAMSTTQKGNSTVFFCFSNMIAMSITKKGKSPSYYKFNVLDEFDLQFIRVPCCVNKIKTLAVFLWIFNCS